MHGRDKEGGSDYHILVHFEISTALPWLSFRAVHVQETDTNRQTKTERNAVSVAQRLGLNGKSIWLVCGGDAPCYMFGARLSIESDNHGLINQCRRIHVLLVHKEHCLDSRWVIAVV